jgi:hypothetical protein
MILTIKGADFSLANIGTLNTVTIRKIIGRGLTHNIPNFISKGVAANWTLTLSEDYELNEYTITMGGEVITPTVSEGVMTISIPSVTGSISINIATTYIGEEDEPVVPPVTPDEPTGYVVYDSFNRANGDLATSDSGHTWVRYASPGAKLQIQDNKVTSNDGYPSELIKIGSGDRTVEAAIEFNGTGQILLYSRMMDSLTDFSKAYYVAARVNSDGLSLLYKDGVNNTVVQTIPLSSSAFVLKLEVIGDTHNVYVDDEMVMSNDVNLYANASYVGIQVTNGNYVDDFKSTMNNINEDVPGEGGEDEDENTQVVGLVYDSFDRENTTSGIGTSDSGYVWEYPKNPGNRDAIIISNGTVISKTAYPSAVCNLGAGDKSVEAVVNASNTGQILLYSRYDLQTAQDYVCARAKNDGLTLMYKQNGVNTEMQTIPIAQLTKQYPFTLKLEVIGDTHNVYVDDEMVMSQDTTLFNDKTYVGFSINGSGNYVDDFRAEMITQ